MASDVELLAKVQETFLAARAKQELQVAQWAEKLANVDPLIFKDIDLPEPLSLRTLIPELYAEKPDEAVYTEQYNKCKELFDKVNAIADEYNEEAKKCLLEFQELSSRQ